MIARFIRGPLQPLLLSFGILIAAWLLAPSARLIPASFSGLWHYGPWLSLGALGLLGLVYRRGRVLLMALLFVLGFGLEQHAGLLAVHGQGPLRVFIVTSIVPVNLALVGWLRERGVLTIFSILRLTFILGQLLLVSLWWRLSPQSFAHALRSLDIMRLAPHLARSGWPQFSYLLLATSGLALLLAAARQKSYLAYGLFAAYSVYAFGLISPAHTAALHASAIGVGLVLSICLLRDAYNLAYRDELTGLPQRRGLNELCLALTGDYAVAMMDVDHFKKFNDTHGHDTGDDVLKMVATHIGRVRDGGKAFRYGGEEFTIVYPSKVKEQTLRSLERVRQEIENYRMVVRAPRRGKAAEESGIAKRGKGATPGANTVSVTISIGVADRSDRTDSPDDVIKKADQALYRAKRSGRNRVVVFEEGPPRMARR